MAKKTRPIADDGATSGPAQPRDGRRMTGRQPASGNAEPGSRQDASQGAPEADLAQDFSPAQYQSIAPEPSEHEIRVRAYHRYLDRGGWDGADFDDWLQAEMELKKR